MWTRGKLPREPMRPRDGDALPPVDVSELVFARQLSDLRWRVENLCMALAKPSTSPSASGASGSIVTRGELLKPYSELWEFLTGRTYSDGSSRASGCISVKCSQGGIQVTLTDPSSGSYCCLTAATLDDALLALEIGLGDGTAPWRASTYSKPKK